MISKFLALFAVFTLSLAACQPASSDDTKLIIESKKGKKTQKTEFTVEIANDDKTRAKGLMFRKSMPENAGMLFLFGDDAERGFWMENTLIPLDIVFIRADGVIHSIAAQAQPHDRTIIYSKGPVRAALEINGGLAAKKGIKPGDRVIHPALAQ